MLASSCLYIFRSRCAMYAVISMRCVMKAKRDYRLMNENAGPQDRSLLIYQMENFERKDESQYAYCDKPFALTVTLQSLKKFGMQNQLKLHLPVDIVVVLFLCCLSLYRVLAPSTPAFENKLEHPPCSCLFGFLCTL